MWHIRMVVVLMAASAGFLAAQDPPSRVGRLNYRDGPVSVQPTGMNEWVDADVNRPLTTGDNVWVGDRGRAEFHIGSTALRLSAYSDFQFLNLDDQTVQIRLSEGTLTIRLRNLAQNQIFEVDTPNLAFTIERPGEYRIDANPDSQTTIITVRDGQGEVSGGGQSFPLYTRQQVVVKGDDQINYNLASAGGADVFDQWCSSRDRREDQSQSASYVSREVPGYDDFDQYGRWGNQPGYGQVWMPTTVAAGWAPYHDGHWAWISPWGWTWVDEAPWGFAPYHYGRWASFGGRWGWVPGPYEVTPVYAPALVGWVGGNGGGSGFSLSFSSGNAAAVGWFPLGPREPYFPAYSVSSGYFGRVNNTNTVINSTTINNYYNSSRNPNDPALNNIRYANRNVQNAVTAVPQDRFANGHRVAESARAVSGAQLATVRFAAAPEIAPQHASVLGPRAGEASRSPRPPVSVLSRPVVARTAPPPAATPFDRQQPELNRNPGRPLPTSTVQQMGQNAPARSSPVHVVDMRQIQRIQPAVGAGPQQGVRQVNPAPGRPGAPNPQPPNAQRQPNAAPPPNVVQQPNAAPPPVVNNRQNQSPSNPGGSQNGRGAPQVARPGTPPPNVVQQPNAAPPPVVNNRQNQSPSNPGGSQNGRGAPQVARPGTPPPNANPQRQKPSPPNVVPQPSPAPPPPANNRPTGPPPSRQQPVQPDRAAPPAQQNRPQAQQPQRQPPQQMKQVPAPTPQPASLPKGAKNKPDKTDEKK